MSVLVPLLVGAAVTAVLVPLLAARLGLLDQPVERSTHARPVARVGGIGILGGVTAASCVVAFAGHGALDDMRVLLAFALPVLVFLGIGVLDDLGRLRTGPKFLLQSLAAALAVGLGLRWEGTGLAPFGDLGFGMATPVMTWLWIIAVVTMINLLDGLDLITATTAAVVLGAAAGAGAGPGHGLLYAAALGSVIGFVPWNRAPARSFLGDGGTHVLGFLVATAALHMPGETQALAWPLASAPLLPGVIDIGWGLIMKARMGVALTKAHNQHLSQRLVHAGWSHAAVAWRYGVLAVVALGLIAWVGPRFGASALAGVALSVLTLHLLHVRVVARTIPHRF